MMYQGLRYTPSPAIFLQIFLFETFFLIELPELVLRNQSITFCFYMNKCILIFDDDAETLAVSKIILEQQNFQVEVRSLCDDIVRDITDTRPFLILIDLWMPEIGGEKAVELIKSNSSTCHLPAILFSANDQIEEICFRCGANGYLKKPFSISDLLDVINSHLLQE